MTIKKIEIKCPKCAHRFKLENDVFQKIEDVVKGKLQIQFDRQCQEFKTAAIKQANKDVALRLMEKDKKLEEQRKQIGIMKQKIEQGSTQLQGEVQEVAIENELGDLFRFDEIKEVPKGVA